jgi:hypothetical protein
MIGAEVFSLIDYLTDTSNISIDFLYSWKRREGHISYA